MWQCAVSMDANLEKAVIPLSNTKYIAISHVWGRALWRFIPGVQYRVLASDKKAKFIAEELRSIVKDNYFWMDILCVDQCNKAARIAITQLIPAIFRNAQRTVFIRDGDGPQKCCAAVMGDCSPTNFRALEAHWSKAHPKQLMDESILSRLWVFQETILSEQIQFVTCDETAPVFENICENDRFREVSRFEKDLHSLAEAWAVSADGLSSELFSQKFKIAFLNSSTVSRTTAVTQTHPTLLVHEDLAGHFDSIRTAREPRDFILATAPHNGFYRVPENARFMTFADLFHDYLHKYKSAQGQHLQPLYIGDSRLSLRELRSGTLPACTSVPEPACLGDFVKLLDGPVLAVRQRISAKSSDTITSKGLSWHVAAYPVRVKSISIPNTVLDCVELAVKAFYTSPLLRETCLNQLHQIQLHSKRRQTQWDPKTSLVSNDTLIVISFLHSVALDLWDLESLRKIRNKWASKLEDGLLLTILKVTEDCWCK